MATRNLAAEQDALKNILESPERQGSYIGTPGASIPDASAATKQLLGEAINTNVYGSGLGPRDVAGGVAQNQTNAVQSKIQRMQQEAEERSSLYGDTTTGAQTDAGPGYSLDDIYGRYGLDTVKTKEELEQEAIAGIQGQLEGIESVYAEKLSAAAEQGGRRIARGEGLSFASGAQYTPFAEARTIEIEEYNRGVTDAIQADMQAEIANLYAAARGEATESYENQQNRAVQIADAYINDMARRYDWTLQEEEMALTEASLIASMTGEYGGTPTIEMLNYLENLNNNAADSARSDAYLAIAQEEAAKKGFQVVEMDDGYYEYDPAIGEASLTKIGDKAPRSTGSGAYVAPIGSHPMDEIIDSYGGNLDGMVRAVDDEGNRIYSQTEINAAMDRQLERSQYGLEVSYVTPGGETTEPSPLLSRKGGGIFQGLLNESGTVDLTQPTRATTEDFFTITGGTGRYGQ